MAAIDGEHEISRGASAEKHRYGELADKARYEAVPLERRAPNMSPVAMLGETATRRGGATALAFQLTGEPDARVSTMTFAELWSSVMRAANGLHAAGVRPGDTVALLTPNLPESAVALFAAQAVGVSAQINPLLTADAIAAILRDCGATALITLAPFVKTDVADKAAAALRAAPDVKLLVEIDIAPHVPGARGVAARMMRPRADRAHGARAMRWAELLRSGSPGALSFTRDFGPETIGAKFHTGGTTGAPRLVPHSFQGMAANICTIRDLVLTDDDVSMLAIPLFHIYGAYVGLMSPLIAGSRVAMLTPQGFRGPGVIDNFWKLVERHKGSFLAAVPQAIAALDRHPVDADVSSLSYLISGSAPLPTALFERFETNTGVRILEGYGLTEGTCVSACNPPHGPRKIGSVGLPMFYSENRIERFDDQDAPAGECAVDEIGEICISGPIAAPNAPPGHAFEAADAPGVLWRRTGDLGRIDADGYLWITGRLKDVIIRGGHNIDPGELEAALERHPAVAFAAVVGQPDRMAGETPCAYVELAPDADVEERALKAFAIKEIAERATRPSAVIILPELPRTSIAKIFKPELRRLALERVYAGALQRAGIDARVQAVSDPTLGHVAEIAPAGDAPLDEDRIREVLDGWPKPWRVISA